MIPLCTSSASAHHAPGKRRAAAQRPLPLPGRAGRLRSSTTKAHLLVHRPACEHHAPQERLDVAELDVRARGALQGILHAEVQVQGIRLH